MDEIQQFKCITYVCLSDIKDTLVHCLASQALHTTQRELQTVTISVKTQHETWVISKEEWHPSKTAPVLYSPTYHMGTLEMTAWHFLLNKRQSASISTQQFYRI